MKDQFLHNAIAVIGLSGYFPGAKDIDVFWRNLRDGVESITFFSDDELSSSGVEQAHLRNPAYVKAKGVINDIEMLDAAFFELTPREAEVMDPQHRIFLECCWEALEHAGYCPSTYSGSIGVYAGISSNTYLEQHLLSNPQALSAAHATTLRIGNSGDFASSRVSYKFHLKGPSITVQSACSSSLVAVHLACQSLLQGECDMALTGGVSITFPLISGYLYSDGDIVSPDGHCRAFDIDAQGTVSGNGAGVVVLKLLTEAIRDGDTIHAVIRGSAVNNDGSAKIGYTAPSIDGQSQVIVEAQSVAGVDPTTITYIEAHGTGTRLGDPIEVAALTKAFSRGSRIRKNFCALGAVKANIGHLDAAAGIAGLIKTILALKYKQIPPNIHFRQPNREIDLVNSPFYVNNKLLDWPGDSGSRRAGVSAFGIGGTNAHVILEEAPPVETSHPSRSSQLIVLSARSETALQNTTANLAAYLQQYPTLNLADVAYTLQAGRQHFSHRRIAICDNREAAIKTLEEHPSQTVCSTILQQKKYRITFMFPGSGVQYENMALLLYQQEPLFRSIVDDCAILLKPHLGADVRDILYPQLSNKQNLTQIIHHPQFMHSALFVVEYALARLLMSWGVYPHAMVGHSAGEYVAACLAGIFSLADALMLVAKRGHLVESLPAGAMLAIQMAEQHILPLLSADVSLAAVNSMSVCVVSGFPTAIDALQQQLTKQGVKSMRLNVLRAFHSAMVDAIVDSFVSIVQRISLNPPQIPLLSNISGTWLSSSEALDPAYWGRQLRQTVRFADSIQTLLQQENQLLLEVGPGQTLSNLARSQVDGHSFHTILNSMKGEQDDLHSDVQCLLAMLGRLWLRNVAIDWSSFYAHERRRRLPLPLYPFERQRYWVEKHESNVNVHIPHEQEITRAVREDMANWFFIPSWRRSYLPPQQVSSACSEQKLCWLIFIDDSGVGDAIKNYLAKCSQRVVILSVGENFERYGDSLYRINPQCEEHYDLLMHELRNAQKLPHIILHLWNITTQPYRRSGHALFQAMQWRGYYSIIFCIQALAREGAIGTQNIGSTTKIFVVTNNAYEVMNEKNIPEQAPLIAACKVIQQEYQDIACRSIDIELPQKAVTWQEPLAVQLMAEIGIDSADFAVAYRGKQRWIHHFEPMPVTTNTPLPVPLRQEGVYLITGGLGNVGLQLATYLAKRWRGQLILTHRSAFPAKAEWSQWLDTHVTDDMISQKIHTLQDIELAGAEILLMEADVANLHDMRKVIQRIYVDFGRLHGVIHTAATTTGSSITSSISSMRRAEAEAQFRPKVIGIYVLEKLLRDKMLDFCLLMSSTAALLGGPGFVAYAGANAFMDAFALAQNKKGGSPWISINWDGWPQQKQETQEDMLHEREHHYLMKADEVPEAFEHALCFVGTSQVIVSCGNLAARFDAWVGQLSKRAIQMPTAPSMKEALSHPSGQTVTPTSELEQVLITIWQTSLGIEQIGADDNFYELGGDSLVALHIVTKAREFGLALTPKLMLEHQTIAELAATLLVMQ